ncbi:MAG: DMT family transporter, partial [Gammaproteobacteria bacterium]|nr:DMT family transporter [Gammaproteobacteria bacterium]
MSTKSDLFPVVSLLLSATLWGILWYPLRRLEESGISGLWASLIIYGSLIPLGLWLSRHSWRQISRYWRHWLLIALASGWCNVAFVLAVLDGTVVRVLLLFYLSPVWAIFFAWLAIGERADRQSLFTVAMAMSGALFMLWDSNIGWPWPRELSDWLALSSGLAFAIANVLIRATSGMSLTMKMSANWLGVVTVALSGVFIFSDPVPMVSPTVWLVALSMGALMLVMTITVQYGVTHLPIYKSSIVL